ncbi:MAG: TonB-dependent receptor [Thiobacillaceae bacterium]|nr:TonB-dependent receptor [Thiobacillaceae bacterium]
MRLTPLSASLSAALWAAGPAALAADALLDDLVVTAARLPAPLGTLRVAPAAELAVPGGDLSGQLAALPGLAVVRNGPLTGIAQMRGLFNERVKVRVDGMEITPACPNHMDPPLHYATPGEIGELEVLSGVTPVSQGGDSLAGTLQARTPPLAFSRQGVERRGAVSVGHGEGDDATDLAARLEFLGEAVSLRYLGSYLSSNDYDYPGGTASNTGVGSSQRHGLTLAGQLGGGVLELMAGTHRTRDAGNAALPMDMVKDDADRLALAWRGALGVGSLNARLYLHDIDHLMDNYSLRPNANPLAQQMWAPAQSRDAGLVLDWERPLGGGDLSLGLEYRANDFDAYQSRRSDAGRQDIINDAERDRLGAYADWWSPRRGNWRYNAGLRLDRVSMDAGRVAFFAGSPAAVQNDAAAFNAAERGLTDTNWDATLLARYSASAALDLEAGLARKSRSPSLLERYEWTPLNASAGQADGRRYLGNLDLDPEVAHTVNLAARYRQGGLEIRPALFYSQVDEFIQGTPIARTAGAGTPADPVLPVLQYQNVDARLYGAEAQWRYAVNEAFSLDGTLSWVRGKNRDNGDHLYRIAPLRATLNATYMRGPWQARGEWLLADRQDDVAAYNGETPTAGHGVVNLRAGYRFDGGLTLTGGVENLFDKRYYDHLGGINRVAGGDVALNDKLPGKGRALHLRLAYAW